MHTQLNFSYLCVGHTGVCCLLLPAMHCTTDKLPTNAHAMHCCPMSGRKCKATWIVLVNCDEFFSTSRSQPPITFQWLKKIVWTLYVVGIFLSHTLWQQNCAWTEVQLTSAANLSVIWMLHFVFCTCSQHFFASHMLKVDPEFLALVWTSLSCSKESECIILQ